MQFAAANLSRNEGPCLLSASEALLKGVLEAEIEVSLLVGPRYGPFASIVGMASETALGTLLRQHGLRLTPSPDAARALTLAANVARSGRAGIVLIPNEQLDSVISALHRAMGETLDRGGSLVLVLEDHPQRNVASCPRLAAQRLNLPCLEPCDISQLRDAVETALRLSRAGRCPVGIIAHASILRSSETIEARPNRAAATGDVLLARKRRQRSPRWSESGGLMRVARRLELNRFRAMPSPGERVSVGFITIGPADESIRHLTHVLELHGRVPVMQLALIHPIDESAVERLLTRCQRVVVLEPRPGSIEPAIVQVAEALRRRGEQPATVWGRQLPPDAAGTPYAMQSDADLHPSVLVRKIAHLLHAIRPTVQVASQLMADPPALPVPLPARGEQIGSSGVLATVRRIVTDVDQWLRDHAPLEEREIEPTALAIDGAELAAGTGATRIVQVELWEHRRFQREGVAALVQAARDDRPCMLLVCESASEEIRDLERLARGAIPAEAADRVTLHTANLSDRVALRDLLREASLSDGLSVVIIRDGPPPRYDVAAIEQSLAEIDRLGFEPVQRLVRSVDEVCALRALSESDAQAAQNAAPLESQFSNEPLVSRAGVKWRLKVRPLLEEVEVVRTRPPAWTWRGEAASKLATPQVVHGRAPQWRAHLAGIRREPPGLAALVLCEAGRLMGYHVRTVCDASAVSPGRRAWTQVLFTRPRPGEPPLPITAAIPFGEADLLLGLDAAETLGAVSPEDSRGRLRVASSDRTHVVANVGDLSNQPDDESFIARAQMIAALQKVSREAPRLLGDFISACRVAFHTDRVVDLALLGAAFQLGLVPVSPEAIDGALNAIEARGFARSKEAFEFGRRLAVDERLFTKPRDDREEDVHRLARRIVLSLSRGRWGRLGGWGGGKRAKQFASLLERTLHAMPGLPETELGRQARRDFLIACHRCLIWGGIEYAQQYASLITRLYEVDRPDTGRMLTRCAILPLADAMLIRDPLYAAAVAGSAEQRRRTRHLLNVRRARGDRIERRYLTRFELVAFKRRLRADVRTSDWPARFASFLRRLVPTRWRGTRHEREMREYLMHVVQRAISGAAADYPHWAEAMQRLHHQAAEDRLRGMAMAEVKMLVEPAGPSEQQPMQSAALSNP